MRSGPAGGLYSFRVSGEGAIDALNKFAAFHSTIGRKLDRMERTEIEVARQQLVLSCRVRAADEPEYYILLAAVFFSNGSWFQTYDIALEGLRKWDSEPTLPTRIKEELLYAKAVGYHQWSLQEIPNVLALGARLPRLLGMYREVLSASIAFGNSPSFVAVRCYREIAAVFGECRELGIALPLVDDDRQVMRSVHARTDAMLSAQIAYAQCAYDQTPITDPLRPYYVNTLLYALTEEDGDDTVNKRNELASELEDHGEVDANFVDTLAYHFLSLAERETVQQRRRKFAEAAKSYIRTALKSVSDKSGYYKQMLGRHETEIDAFLERHELAD